MPNLKLKKSLAKENYVKTLVIKGTCEVKENVVDYEDRKCDPQLVNDIMSFINIQRKILISLKSYKIL